MQLRCIGLVGVTTVFLFALAAIAQAADAVVGDISLVSPWARATPVGAPVGGGYLQIKNAGATADRLVGGSVPFADRLEVHEMAVVDGVMRMRHLPEGLEIPAGGGVTLEPGGMHLMFVGLTQPLLEGDVLEVTLEFQRAGKVEVEFPVGGIGGGMPDAAMTHEHMQMN